MNSSINNSVRQVSDLDGRTHFWWTTPTDRAGLLLVLLLLIVLLLLLLQHCSCCLWSERLWSMCGCSWSPASGAHVFLFLSTRTFYIICDTSWNGTCHTPVMSQFSISCQMIGGNSPMTAALNLFSCREQLWLQDSHSGGFFLFSYIHNFCFTF